VTAQIIAAVIVTAAACFVIFVFALLRQAGRHIDDRAALLRGQLDAYRAGQASVWAQMDEQQAGPDWWDRQFDGITSGLGSGEWGSQ
jgi:hypothetical protein